MEVCILKFGSADGADDALKEVVNAQGDRNPWLYDVGVVRRPLLGRMSIRATFADEPPALREGDVKAKFADAGAMTGYLVGSLAGPLHADLAAIEGRGQGAGVGKAVEKRLLRAELRSMVLKATEPDALLDLMTLALCGRIQFEFEMRKDSEQGVVDLVCGAEGELGQRGVLFILREFGLELALFLAQLAFFGEPQKQLL